MWIAIIVTAIVIIAVVSLCLTTYLIVFYSPHKNQNNAHRLTDEIENSPQKENMVALIDELIARPYRKVRTKSFDGLQLSGKYYHTDDNAPLAICFHGYRGVAERDYCGGGKFLLENNQNVLLVDQRAHGLSKGHTLTFGIKERFDVLSWVNFALQEWGNDTRIALYGISMGATTVLMSADLPLPKNVKVIVADCPYSSPKEIIRKVCNDKKLPTKFLYPFIWLGAMMFGHFNVNKDSAIEAVKNSNIPILLIHGEADSFVPCEMSHRIYNANPQKITLLTFPNAEHGLSYVVDTDRYVKLCLEFLNRYL